ncbi:MAG: aspartyl/asparaginyl beta-hydroxylase domain-containing protein [Burkholderiales bacterium]
MDRLDEIRAILAGSKVCPESPIPSQRPAYYFPSLTARAWWPKEDFECVAYLERNALVIRRELEHVLADGDGFQPYVQPEGKIHDSGDWDVLYLYFHGKTFAENQRRCPETARIISGIERRGGMIYFSRLTPGTRIARHCGLTNVKLRCHLGLVVPDGCGLRVGDEGRTWEEGKCLVFDDSFEHEVWHDGSRDRVVLIVDFYHPELSVEEIGLIEHAEKYLLATAFGGWNEILNAR